MNKEIEEMAQVLPDTLPDWFDKNRKIILAKSFKTQIAQIYYKAGYRKLKVVIGNIKNRPIHLHINEFSNLDKGNYKKY